jgi:ATP-binding cassette subfamily F protein uup
MVRTGTSRSNRNKATFAQKREFEALEQQMPKLSTRKEELEKQLSSGSMEGDDLMNAANEIGTIIQQLDEAEMRWLELSELEF